MPLDSAGRVVLIEGLLKFCLNFQTFFRAFFVVFSIFSIFFSKYWNAKPSKYLPSVNFPILETFPVFPVFPVFLRKKEETLEKKLLDKNGRKKEEGEAVY